VLRLKSVPIPTVAALSAAMAYAVSFWLVLLHHAEGGHEHNEPALLVHWLRDGTLALPGVVAAVWLGAALMLGLVDRHARLPALWRSALVAVGAAVAGAIVLAAGSPVHAWLFDVREANGLPAGLHLGRDALIALSVGLPVAGVVVAVAGLVVRRRTATALAVAPRVSVHEATAEPHGLTRRNFVRYGAGGVATAGLVGTSLVRASRPARAEVVTDRLALFINDGHVAMVDGTLVYMRGFGEVAASDPNPSLTIAPRVFLADGRGPLESRLYPLEGDAEVPEEGTPADDGIDDTGPRLHFISRRRWASFFPRRTIVAESGSTIKLTITNRLRDAHTFTIAEAGVDVTVAPGETKDIDFAAPAPGTYIYHDKTDAPVNRVLGLHGVLVVVPADRPWTFDGTDGDFERQWVWLLADIDPEWGRLARLGTKIDPEKTPCLPRYFTLNDRSGVFSLAVSPDEAENLRTLEDTKPSGHARTVDVRDFLHNEDAGVGTGQLIRLVNAGVAVHQPHFHGNHVWTIAIDNKTLTRTHVEIVDGHIELQHWEDVVEMDAFTTKAVMLPLKPPPDALDVVRANQECDWVYPMHCHAEMSQTAGGGLYPGGQVSDWILKP
jgi:Cupredoxin-like domain